MDAAYIPLVIQTLSISVEIVSWWFQSVDYKKLKNEQFHAFRNVILETSDRFYERIEF